MNDEPGPLVSAFFLPLLVELVLIFFFNFRRNDYSLYANISELNAKIQNLQQANKQGQSQNVRSNKKSESMVLVEIQDKMAEDTNKKLGHLEELRKVDTLQSKMAKKEADDVITQISQENKFRIGISFIEGNGKGIKGQC